MSGRLLGRGGDERRREDRGHSRRHRTPSGNDLPAGLTRAGDHLFRASPSVPNEARGSQGDPRVRAHQLGRGVRHHRRAVEHDQAGIRSRGSVHLHRSRRVRALAMRHVPAEGRCGVLGLERPVSVRFSQYDGCGGALLRLVRDDRALGDAGTGAGQHVHGHGERGDARRVGRQPRHGLPTTGHAPAGGRRQAGGRHRRDRPAPHRDRDPHRRPMGPDPTGDGRSARAQHDRGDDRRGAVRRALRRRVVPRVR